ncbi:hypothetical protein AHF37_10673 [Paragonimus kellicotti]|nr:hypothetical protein AHF37_10673 [Paragonimus kellicotti]
MKITSIQAASSMCAQYQVQVAHRNSFDSSVANASTSSVEDLLHGAISDVELPGSSPSSKRLVHRNLPPVLDMHRKCPWYEKSYASSVHRSTFRQSSI